MDVIPIPNELRGVKAVVDSYVTAKVKQFAVAFARNLNLGLSEEQLEQVTNQTLGSIARQEQMVGSNRILRLVLRHDCQSTGCGEGGCLLCQYNPSRLCKRNLKNKYLIDDHLKAKCGAPLRVELVDETGACVAEGLPAGVQLEVNVLNGEKYKEICPDNTLLSHQQLKSCVISHHQKALLRRDGGSDDALRCFLRLERGQAPLSDLTVTTSSEALLAGKAPTFRLLVWAVDSMGEPVPNVTYVVSENFVVATKRVKHAIKSDIPSVADHVSKLVHIGKATVDKLLDLRTAATEEGFEIHVPDDLNCVDKVGTFQRLVELSEMNSDLKNKVRHLLKLSPEKWEEVAQHAQAAVMPDFRPRVWWCTPIRAGLLFECKNGSVSMEHPIALVKMGDGKGKNDTVAPIHTLDPELFNKVPSLKTQAIQSWYAAGHPGWAIYWKEGQQDPAVLAMMQQSQAAAGVAGQPVAPPVPNIPVLQSGGSSSPFLMQMFASSGAKGSMGNGTPSLFGSDALLNILNTVTQEGGAYTAAGAPPPANTNTILPPPPPLQQARPSPFHIAAGGPTPMDSEQQQPSQQQQLANRPANKSPFASVGNHVNQIQPHFPTWQSPAGASAAGVAAAATAQHPAGQIPTSQAPTTQATEGSAEIPLFNSTPSSLAKAVLQQQQQQQEAQAAANPVPGSDGGGSLNVPMVISQYNSLEMLKSSELANLDRGSSLFGGLPSAILGGADITRSQDWSALQSAQLPPLAMDSQQLQQVLQQQIPMPAISGVPPSPQHNAQPQADGQ